MRSNVRTTKKRNSRGFTMVELMVTLAVMGILLAITFVGLNAWIRNSEFKKCNEYAHSIYTSASLELSGLELASELDRFTEEVIQNGLSLSSSDVIGTDAAEVFEPGRMYALSAKAGDYDAHHAGMPISKQAEMVYELIDNFSYDKEVCDYTITIEYDTYSQSVYAVYVSSWAKEFVYENLHSGDYKAYDERGTVSLNATGIYERNRSAEVLKAMMVGYYCVDELGIRAVFNEGQLRVTQCYLDNGETLDLVVSSNSIRKGADVKYIASIYKKQNNGDKKLFEMTFSLVDLLKKLSPQEVEDIVDRVDSIDSLKTPQMTKFEVKRYMGEVLKETKEMYFPVAWQGDELRVTLDATMSAQVKAAYSGLGEAGKITSTSFSRFLDLNEDVPDICVSARVEQLTQADLPNDFDQARRSVRLWIETDEYMPGSAVVSNTENAFFASVSQTDVGITTMRHLANISYYNQNKDAKFRLSKDLWFEDAVIYDTKTNVEGSENPLEPMELHTTKAFPMIPEFSEKWSLTGERTLSNENYSLNQMMLTRKSYVNTDGAINFGMIGQNKGRIHNLTFHKATSVLGYEVKAESGGAVTYERPKGEQAAEATESYVRAAGILCGRNLGTITDIVMDDMTSAHVALNYRALNGDVTNGSLDRVGMMHGIGLVCGVHDGYEALADIRTAGQLEGYYYGINATESNAIYAGDSMVYKRYRFAGIGGVCGLTLGRKDEQSHTIRAIGSETPVTGPVENFLNLTDNTSVRNTAMISGNSFVGGITGNIWFFEDATQDIPIIENCVNEGRIQLVGKKFNLVKTGDSEQDKILESDGDRFTADNCFAGGIIGLLYKGQIKNCSSAPGVSDSDFLAAVSDETLNGEKIFPGAIPKTKAHAYLEKLQTGNYVGGVAGCVMDGVLQDCMTTEGGYVLGNDEVGGIVGYLASSNTSQERMRHNKELQNGCYVIGHSNVGGIVGSNRAGNIISNCRNEGVIAGFGNNIGGIVGSNVGLNNTLAVIENCTSEVFDYDNAIYHLVVDVWQIYGNNAGGLVGFNEYGTVRYKEKTEDDQTIINVSAIVVGNHNVGGVFGVAGKGTKFDFKHYSIDGGEVYALFDNAGGYIGANLSEDALPTGDELKKLGVKTYEVRPYIVRGRYGVGGAIGTNVIVKHTYYYSDDNRSNDINILFSNTNEFGTVYGMSAVGGIVGYQRNILYTNDNLYQSVYGYAVEHLPADGFSGFVRHNQGQKLPYTDAEGIIQQTNTAWLEDRPSYNGVGAYTFPVLKHQTTITGSNSATVVAGSYGGGIIGYGCSYDQIRITECTNQGDIWDWRSYGITDSKELINGSILMRTLPESVMSESTYDEVKNVLASDVVATEKLGSFLGGIEGYVAKQTTLSNCTQKGMMYTKDGCGGIAGINLGKIQNCHVLSNLGTQESDLIGGIVALNGKGAGVTGCNVGTFDSDYTIEGKSLIGGFFAINESENDTDCSKMYANISCALEGSMVGGMAGYNAGILAYQGDAAGLGGTKNTVQIIERIPPLQISGGTYVGGVAGVMKGQLKADQTCIISDKVSVTGQDRVGGLFGVYRDASVTDNDNQPISYENKAIVAANDGYAGGIAGVLISGRIEGAHNLAEVSAYGENGYAGGIVAYVDEKGSVKSCRNNADITSLDSMAGGICAWNEGTLSSNDYLSPSGEGETRSIRSNDENMGIIASYNKGIIHDCNIKKASVNGKGTITLQGSGSIIGGIVGTNEGTITNSDVKTNYAFDTASEKELTIGGAIGKNVCMTPGGKVEAVNVENYEISLQGNCAYFGGLIGQSTGSGIVSKCTVNGLDVSEDTASLRSSCYGGAIGSNASTASGITVKNIKANINGLYQANITLEAEKQEDLANCFGGIVGKNETSGRMEVCSLDTSEGYDKNQIVVTNGLVGGILGMNKGLVSMCGYEDTTKIMQPVQTAFDNEKQEQLKAKAGYEKLLDKVNEKDVQGNGIVANRYTTAIPKLNEKIWTDKNKSVEKWAKDTLTTDNQKLMMLVQLTGNGSVGGITASNTSTATMEYCMSGRWLVDNRSSSQYSAQGGIIGTNESENDTRFLVNQAMVLRESSSGVTERVNGGVIGNQHNTTSDQWSIYGCINTGMVVNNKSHYSGGIIGRWSDQGGSIDHCRNYGMIQTSFNLGWRGATGGIVAQLYHPVDHQSYTILSCRNDGKIWGTGEDGRDYNNCANESGGMMGNVITYQASNKDTAQPVQLNIVDCVNGPEATIICYSMGGGMLGYMTSDGANSDTSSLANLELNIDRCRNYCTDYEMLSGRGFAGIFGDRDSGHEKTRITNCFTLFDKNKTDYGKKGYICNDAGSSNGNNYLYDGGKSSVCENNRVLLLDNTDVDATVKVELQSPSMFAFDPAERGICYPILQDNTQSASGLDSLVDNNHKEGAYTVSGSRHGGELYIQLRHPMKLDELSLKFDDTGKKHHSFRVEYVVEDPQTNRSNSDYDKSLTSNYILAKEAIQSTNSEETIRFPSNATIYALRIHFVQNGVEKSNVSPSDKEKPDPFQQFGYYYGKDTDDTSFNLADLKLTYKNNQGTITALPLSAGASIVSPRLVDVAVTGADHLRNGNTQYLYVATSKDKQYLIEPQFEEKRLSDDTNRAKYYKDKSYVLVGNQMIYSHDNFEQAYGSVFATFDSGKTLSFSSENRQATCEMLDQMMINNYKYALAAAMPYAEDVGKVAPRPETPSLVELSVNQSDPSMLDIKWKNSIDGARNVVSHYLLTLKDADKQGKEYISNKKCFGNEWSIDITPEMEGKKLQAQVMAVNENGTSKWCESKAISISETMPTPQIRLEMNKRNNDGSYQYKVTLLNQKDYEAYENWSVEVYRQGTHHVGTINQKKKELLLNCGFKPSVIDKDPYNHTPSKGIWLLYAQAKSGDQVSEKFVTSVYTPNDYSATENAIPGIKELYATFDNSYKSELDAKINVFVSSETAKTGIYPIYQVDLIRVDAAGETHIVESKELAVSDQLSNVTFTELPTEFFDSKKTEYFYVRAWLSQTGVGPVYTWHETDSLNPAKGSLLVNTKEAEQKYVTGVILSSEADAFGTRMIMTPQTNKNDTIVAAGASLTDDNRKKATYSKTTKYAITAVPDITSVKAIYDETKDQLKYQFSWKDSSDAKQYEVRIYGVTSSEENGTSKVQIASGMPSDKRYELVVDDLKYSDIEVVIIQRKTGYAPGDEESKDDKGRVVPRATVYAKTIRTRLPKQSQPSVKLVDKNNLNYQISWQDISSYVDSTQRDQIKYAVYARKKVDNDNDSKFEKLLSTSQTSVICDLEKYGFQNADVQFYVIAYISDDDLNRSYYQQLPEITAMFKSPIGLWKTLHVGKRITTPQFDKDNPFVWVYRDMDTQIDVTNPQHALTQTQFTSNSLKLIVQMNKNHNYVMNGVLFKTKDEADGFIDQINGTSYEHNAAVERTLIDDNYVKLSNSGKPIAMNLVDSENHQYAISPAFKDITYAGGYLVPLVRATSTTKISSYWVLDDLQSYQIPMVQLDTPNLTQEIVEKEYPELGENLRNPTATNGTPFTNAKVQYEAYRFSVPSYVEENVVTLTAGEEIYKLSIKKKSEQGDAQITISSDQMEDEIFTLADNEEHTIESIRNDISGSYRLSRTLRAFYRMSLYAGIRKEVVDGEEIYILRLPQTESAIACDGGIFINGSTQLISDVHIQAIPYENMGYLPSAGKE